MREFYQAAKYALYSLPVMLFGCGGQENPSADETQDSTQAPAPVEADHPYSFSDWGVIYDRDPSSTAWGRSYRDPLAVDFDGDGDLDVVVLGEGKVVILENRIPQANAASVADSVPADSAATRN